MNRGFLYGDGFFETIRTVEGIIYLLPYHLERVKEAMEILQFESDHPINEEYLIELIEPDKNPDHLIRISFYRDGEGKYAPMNNFFKTHVTSAPIESEFFIPKELDLRAELKHAPYTPGTIGVYPIPKPDHPLFTIKSLSSAYYVLAAKYGAENAINYLFLINDKATILEELTSNLLLTNGDLMYIPVFSGGCVKGATMRYIKQQYGFQLEEIELKTDQLNQFDEIYLTKGSTGISRIK